MKTEHAIKAPLQRTRRTHIHTAKLNVQPARPGLRQHPRREIHGHHPPGRHLAGEPAADLAGPATHLEHVQPGA